MSLSKELRQTLVNLRLFCLAGTLEATIDIAGSDDFAVRGCLAALWRFVKFSDGGCHFGLLVRGLRARF